MMVLAPPQVASDPTNSEGVPTDDMLDSVFMRLCFQGHSIQF
jgi:hypothetical protein